MKAAFLVGAACVALVCAAQRHVPFAGHASWHPVVLQAQALAGVSETVVAFVLLAVPAQVGLPYPQWAHVAARQGQQVVVGGWVGVTGLQGQAQPQVGAACGALALCGQQGFEGCAALGLCAVVQRHEHRAVGQVQGDGVRVGSAGEVAFVARGGLQQLGPCPAGCRAGLWVVAAQQPLAQAGVDVGAGADLADDVLGAGFFAQ